jgi:hypothetical protein
MDVQNRINDLQICDKELESTWSKFNWPVGMAKCWRHKLVPCEGSTIHVQCFYLPNLKCKKIEIDNFIQNKEEKKCIPSYVASDINQFFKTTFLIEMGDYISYDSSSLWYDLESTALLLIEYYNILRLLNDIRANSKIRTEQMFQEGWNKMQF